MDTLHAALAWLDPLFITPYRLPGNALAGFALGTAVLALWCIAFGSALSLCATRINRRRLAELRHGMEHHHKLSEAALRAGDKESYKAVNRQAHEAFGHYFSLGGAMFCVSIIPLPFALAWMDMRFAGATPELPWDAPLIGQQPSILFWFLLRAAALHPVLVPAPVHSAAHHLCQRHVQNRVVHPFAGLGRHAARQHPPRRTRARPRPRRPRLSGQPGRPGRLGPPFPSGATRCAPAFSP